MSTQSLPASAEERAHFRHAVVLAGFVLIVQCLISIFYIWSLGNPTPHKVHIIVASRHEGNAGYIANQLNAQTDHPVRATITTNQQWAQQQVKDNKAAGVYVFNPLDKVNDLYYATAQPSGNRDVVEQVGAKVAAKAHTTIRGHDLVPTAAQDKRGIVPFYLVLGLIIGSYLLPTMLGTLTSPRASTWGGVGWRLGVFVIFSAIAGILGAWLARDVLDALNGPFWGLAAVGAGLSLSVSIFAYGLTSLLGPAALAVNLALFVILGNPSAGGAFGYDLLPGFMHDIGPFLPNGAATDAMRDVAYFHGTDLLRPTLVLLAWFILGLWLVYMVSINTLIGTTPDQVAEMQHEDGFGLVGQFVEHHAPHHSNDSA